MNRPDSCCLLDLNKQLLGQTNSELRGHSNVPGACSLQSRKQRVFFQQLFSNPRYAVEQA